ncbi:hypothetical protein CR513_39437, partial [Mucuna pruriens]
MWKRAVRLRSNKINNRYLYGNISMEPDEALQHPQPLILNLLTEQDNQTHEVTPKHNIFNKEVRFEEINQNMDDWTIPEIP